MSSSSNQQTPHCFIIFFFFFLEIKFANIFIIIGTREFILFIQRANENNWNRIFYKALFIWFWWGGGHINFCGKAIILHSFNSNFVNAVTNIMTRGDIPTLQRPPFDLSCIFSENYEIKAFPDICKVCLYLPLRYVYVHSHLSSLY